MTKSRIVNASGQPLGEGVNLKPKQKEVDKNAKIVDQTKTVNPKDVIQILTEINFEPQSHSVYILSPIPQQQTPSGLWKPDQSIEEDEYTLR